MVLPLIAAGISAVGGLASSAMGASQAKKDRAQAAKQHADSMAMADEAANLLIAQGVPKAEAMRVALETAQLGPSALEDLMVDPRLRQAQMGALEKMQQIGETGQTAAERAEELVAMQEIEGAAQARDKAILQDMAQKGMGGSGAELIARLQGSQSAANRAATTGAQLQGQAQNRALQAMMQGAQLGGQVRGQEYGEQSNLASAQDRIAQFNAMQRADIANQQEMHNKALKQREFENQMARKQAIAAAKTGQAQMGAQRAGQMEQAAAQRAAASAQQSGALFGLAGSLGKSYFDSQSSGGGGATAKSADGGIMGYEDGGVAEEEQQMMMPEQEQAQTMGPTTEAPNSNGGFAGGGIPVEDDLDGQDMEETDYLEGAVVPGDDFEDDRVDAKVNSGEMVINLEQQQRLMELLKGYRDLSSLGDEDIVEDADTGEAPDITTPETLKEYACGGTVHKADGGLIGDFTSDMDQYSSRHAVGYEDGGMIGDFTSDQDTYSSRNATEEKPRGLHASLRYEQEQEEKATAESKRRKARMKAYETLLKGGR